MNVWCPVAKAHTLTESTVMYSDKWLTDLTWGSSIGWSCGTLLTLWPRHSTPLSLKVWAHGMCRMSLPCFLLCLGLLGGLGLPLSSRLMQPSNGMLVLSFWNRFLLRNTLGIVLSNSSFSEWLQGCTIHLLTWTGTCTPPISLSLQWAEPSPMQSVPDHQDTYSYGPLVVPQLPYGCVAGWWLKVNQITANFLGKAWHCLVGFGSCGHVEDCQNHRRDGCCVWAGSLDAHSILPWSEQWFWMNEVSSYCGPHIGHQFLLQWGFIHDFHFCRNLAHAYWVHMELKTPTLLMLLDIIIYLILWLWGFSTIKGDIQSIPLRRSQERNTVVEKNSATIIIIIINTNINKLSAECYPPLLTSYKQYLAMTFNMT